MAEGFRSQDVGLRAQKKVLSRMANNRTLVKSVIDATTGQLLDNLHKLAKNQSGSKKEADKVIKYIVKIAIKIGLLYNHDQFTNDELKISEDIVYQFQDVVKNLLQNYEKPQSYDRDKTLELLGASRDLIKSLVVNHLTPKSVGKVDYVFNFFDGKFLDDVFSPNYKDRQLVETIAKDIKLATVEWGW